VFNRPQNLFQFAGKELGCEVSGEEDDNENAVNISTTSSSNSETSGFNSIGTDSSIEPPADATDGDFDAETAATVGTDTESFPDTEDEELVVKTSDEEKDAVREKHDDHILGESSIKHDDGKYKEDVEKNEELVGAGPPKNGKLTDIELQNEQEGMALLENISGSTVNLRYEVEGKMTFPWDESKLVSVAPVEFAIHVGVYEYRQSRGVTCQGLEQHGSTAFREYEQHGELACRVYEQHGTTIREYEQHGATTTREYEQHGTTAFREYEQHGTKTFRGYEQHGTKTFRGYEHGTKTFRGYEQHGTKTFRGYEQNGTTAFHRYEKQGAKVNREYEHGTAFHEYEQGATESLRKKQHETRFFQRYEQHTAAAAEFQELEGHGKSATQRNEQHDAKEMQRYARQMKLLFPIMALGGEVEFIRAVKRQKAKSFSECEDQRLTAFYKNKRQKKRASKGKERQGGVAFQQKTNEHLEYDKIAMTNLQCGQEVTAFMQNEGLRTVAVIQKEEGANVLSRYKEGDEKECKEMGKQEAKEEEKAICGEQNNEDKKKINDLSLFNHASPFSDRRPFPCYEEQPEKFKEEKEAELQQYPTFGPVSPKVEEGPEPEKVS